MKSRLIASVALGAAVLLGSTGCSLISPQATLIQYAPSDGVEVMGTGALKVRNVLVVANEAGTAGNLVAAIVNESDEPQTLDIDVDNGTITDSIRVPANSTVSLGTAEDEPLLLEGIDAQPGSLLPIYFTSGDQGSLAQVPVLDNTLEYLRDLAPTPTPSATR
ncbi:hypothetical protein CVS47_02242 [Microbacterium lemovicicum]|uniref:DNA modification methylase n=1 Tax=Microbacterium lemovicicum TaxID=1072463 RepID=A0A3Q9J0Y3_9MICO|nr:DNA modification methylase [Microbacterium lemovicicum]AZS37602.1 hypothetical protein CVS47_02242 [Microbacterium lemovicicum]